MKQTILFLVLIAALIVVGFLTIPDFAYVLGAIVAFLYTLAVFGAGWFSGMKSVKIGASIATESQRIDNEADVRKMDAVGRVVAETLRAARVHQQMASPADSGFPPLLGMNDAVDADFVMTGFEAEPEETLE